MAQIQMLYTGQKIGIGNRLKILPKILLHQFMILLQDSEFHISMEVVILERQHMQSESLKI